MASGNDFGGADTAAAFGGNAPSGFGGGGFDASRGPSSAYGPTTSFQARTRATEAAIARQLQAVEKAREEKEAKAIQDYQFSIRPGNRPLTEGGDIGYAPGVGRPATPAPAPLTLDDFNNLFNSDFSPTAYNAPAPDPFDNSLIGPGAKSKGNFGSLVSRFGNDLNPIGKDAEDLLALAGKGITGTALNSIYDEYFNDDNLPGRSRPDGNEFADLAAPARFDYDSAFGDDGGAADGNFQAIRRFLSDPTFKNIPTNNFDTGRGISALEQALLGIDDTVSNRGFEGLGFAESGRDRARDIFDNFGEGDSIEDLLNFNVGQQFGTDALTDTQNQFRSDFTDTANQRFGNDFQLNLIDPDAFSTTVDNILGDRRDSASRIIGNAGARGNLSTLGQATANQSLGTQEAGARDTLTGIARGVESQGQQGLTGIADEARSGASGFALGDSAFDITPFSDRATSFRSDTSGSFNDDVSTALGSDPLFDSGTALSTAAGSQGVVSGTPSFLDSIATRQAGGASNAERRGLGSRGSGTF